MLKFKPKILYNVIFRNNHDQVKECIESILAQDDVRPYIAASCLNSTDNSFSWCKTLVGKNPSVYDPSMAMDEKYATFMVSDERAAITNGIIFGNSKEVQYYCFMYCPGILAQSYSKRAVKCMNEDTIGAYSDIIDSGIKIYTHLNVDSTINIGSFVFLKSSIAQRFGHNTMPEFLASIVNLGVFAHIPEFLAESKWIQSIS